MATTPRRTPAHQVMINCLHGAYILHGQPTFAKISETVERLRTLYPDYRAEDCTGLSSPANIYKIIMGRHGSLPTTPQLSRLILAFQHLAWVERVIRDDPGTSTLPGWQALLSQAIVLDIAQRNRGDFIEDTCLDPTQPVRLPSPMLAPIAELPGAWTLAASVSLTCVEVSCLTALGPYAASLAVRATEGDPGAMYEVSVGLFVSGTPYNERAAAFAANAAAAGVSTATDLLIASETGMAAAAELAVRQARALEYAARTYGRDDAARFFTTCAARLVVKEQALDG
ncbi:hypothetical protein [Actinomadura macra]|uniref:hypothetical protein n=1 Tax=Actinomadura macra TaxID=46164 RepID=UPI0008315C0D|nr:hypothetical protein [Actinomadura macra]